MAPQGDHYRTRLTHTLEVSQIARTIAKALRLNEDLVEAIALGHDLGHTPFGHAGERALDAVNPDGFAHYKQSVRVAQVLEKNGEGLNLTWEVRDGILNHRTSGNPSTLEGKVVRLSDKIAYIHHDMDDAQRAGIISEDDIPITLRMLLGYTTRERLNTFVHDVIENSLEQDTIKMSAEIYEAMMDLRALMFQNVYENPAAHKEEEKVVKQNNGLNLWIGTQKSCEGYGNFAVLHLFLWLIHTRKRKQTFRFVVLALAFQISGIGQQINGGFK